MTRLTLLAAASALLLPFPALAAEDCSARIAAIESHPAFAEGPAEETGEGDESGASRGLVADGGLGSNRVQNG